MLGCIFICNYLHPRALSLPPLATFTVLCIFFTLSSLPSGSSHTDLSSFQALSSTSPAPPSPSRPRPHPPPLMPNPPSTCVTHRRPRRQAHDTTSTTIVPIPYTAAVAAVTGFTAQAMGTYAPHLAARGRTLRTICARSPHRRLSRPRRQLRVTQARRTLIRVEVEVGPACASTRA